MKPSTRAPIEATAPPPGVGSAPADRAARKLQGMRPRSQRGAPSHAYTHRLISTDTHMLASPYTETPAYRAVPATGHDAARALDTLTLAFATDPAVRWLFPDPHQYLRYFPALARALGGAAIAHGTAYVTESYAGTALWLPPDAGPDEAALGTLLEESGAAQERPQAAWLFAAMAAYHPAAPHWYLPLIGVEPLHQGYGLGSALLQTVLRQCDEAHLPAYLESTNPRNVPLYQRHGFKVLGTIRVGRCPPIIPMVRLGRA